MVPLNATGIVLRLPSARAQRLIVPVFAATLFLSALLLFAVQPMFTKMVLPRLGGSPAVWSTAMVAFQTYLFVGYLYAHLLARALAPRQGALLHLALLALVAMTLPLGIARGFEAMPAQGVTLWLIGLFTASVALPFVALAATAPLLQHWFIATGHVQARNPYVLYAASNLGSFCALLAYPFVIEPHLALGTQSAAWSLGFVVLAVGICLAALFAVAGDTVARGSGERPAIAQRLRWLAYAAVPAGLCIAVTAYITTDLAAVPFLWVVPLALYLLTFVGIFRERPWFSHSWVLRLVPYAVAPLAISLLGGTKAYWLVTIVLNLAAFVLIALACHGEAYRLRPAPGRLTEFYLWLAFGGVVGGVFAALVAPNVFNNTYEYPVLLSAALLVLPGVFAGGTTTFLRQAGPLLVAAALVAAVPALFDVSLPEAAQLPMQLLLVALAALMLLQVKRPARFLGLTVLAFAITSAWQAGGRPVETVRSFFGVHRAVESADRVYRILYHGTTIHGAQRVRDEEGRPVGGRPEPLTYYYFGGPISQVVEAVRQARGGLEHVAVVGLGTGSMACHKHDGESWRFYEIDPEVIRLARNPAIFRFLSACAPDVGIVVGDARITLSASKDRYDLIVLDAFSSDAIPVHLLTREAFAANRARLKPKGVIAVHVSNRYMELVSVVAAVGAAEGLVGYFGRDEGANDFRKSYRAKAQVVALARAADELGALTSLGNWRRLDPPPSVAPWSDDYSDVLGALVRQHFSR
jgi:hypothetical protein